MIYRVTANHTTEKFGCSNAIAHVEQDGYTYYAVMNGYGCSKNYNTPEAAIRGMLEDHGCTNIKIVKIG